LVALVLTHSRGGIAATFVGLALSAGWIGYVFTPRLSAPRRGMVGLALVAVLVVAFASFAAQGILRAEYQGLDDARWCTFRSTLRAIADHPWLGTGFGTFQDVFPAYRDPACGIYGFWSHAHDVYLEGYLGLGLAFALLLTFCIGILVRTFAVGYRQRRRYRFAPIIGIGCLLLVMLNSLVDFSIEIPGVAVYLEAVLGAASVLSLGHVNGYRRAP
jgi:O-antigen ligase